MKHERAELSGVFSEGRTGAGGFLGVRGRRKRKCEKRGMQYRRASQTATCSEGDTGLRAHLCCLVLLWV